MYKLLFIFYFLVFTVTGSFSQNKQAAETNKSIGNSTSKPIIPSGAALNRYAGIYQLTTDKSRTITVSRENDHLKGEISGQTTLPLVFKSATKFEFEGVADAACEFITKKGRVTSIIVFQNGKFIWKKIK
jgi:Domain of unknown function (DUF3471)